MGIVPSGKQVVVSGIGIARFVNGRFAEVQENFDYWGMVSQLGATPAGLARIIKVWSAESGQAIAVTTDRFDSYSPAFSPDGKWLYLLSERNLKTVVRDPWGPNQPDPFLDKTTKIYQLALKPGQRSPFQPSDEVFAAKEKSEKAQKKQSEGKSSGHTVDKSAKGDSKKDEAKEESPEPAKVEIDWANISARLYEVPVPPGNYGQLAMPPDNFGRLVVTDKALFYTTYDRAQPDKLTLMGLEIKNDSIEPKQVLGEIKSAELSGDGKKILVQKGRVGRSGTCTCGPWSGTTTRSSCAGFTQSSTGKA